MKNIDKEMCIGDDGLYMTKKRIRLHQALNAILIWGIISLLATIAFASSAYFQGQTFDGFELVATGGNTFNGYYSADLLRLEAGFCFVSGILFVITYQAGFMWFYEKRSRYIYLFSAAAIVIIALVWEGFLLNIGAFDPVALISITALCIIGILTKQVEREHKEIDLSV